MNHSTSPPRKRSRFFFNGKSIIKSWRGGKSEENNTDKTFETVESRSRNGSSPLPVGNSDRYFSTAGAAKVESISEAIEIRLPDRSLSDSSSTFTYRRNNERLSKQLNGGISIVPRNDSNYRRQGLYGIHNVGCAEHTSQPLPSEQLQLAPVNLPTNLREDRYSTTEHFPVPSMSVADVTSVSSASLLLARSHELFSSNRYNHNMVQDRAQDIGDQNDGLEDAVNQSRTKGLGCQPDFCSQSMGSAAISNGGRPPNKITAEPSVGFEPVGNLANASLRIIPERPITRELHLSQPWHESRNTLAYSGCQQALALSSDNSAKHMHMSHDANCIATDLNIPNGNHIHQPLSANQQPTHCSVLSIPQPKFTMSNLKEMQTDTNAFVHPAAPPKHAAAVLGCHLQDTLLDLDRDSGGALLPSHLRQFAASAPQPPYVRCMPRTTQTIPANMYTSPKRVERAIAVSTSNLKRKHPSTDMPPPAYVYVHTGNPKFNIFSNGFLLYPELCLALAFHLPLRDLLALYSISKDFHTIIDSRFTTTCLGQALRKAPQSAQTFRFRTYAQFCRDDPAIRIPHPDPAKAALNIPRKIPSLKWVAFVLHREKVVHELMTVFAERGCPLPARCSLALKRVWLLLDIPDNARRVAMIHNHRQFTDLDLYFLMCFFVKLDMIANDPVAAHKLDGLRKLLLSQREGLDIILKVLKRETWQKKSDIILAWVRTFMSLDRVNVVHLDAIEIRTVFGVPRDQVGIGKFEYWGSKGIINEETGKRRGYLLRPDQLVMREAIRRGMRFSKHFLRCVLYGYVQPDTLESYQPRRYGRRIAAWDDEDYEMNGNLGGARSLFVDEGGDSLLDLGNRTRGSRYTIQKEPISKQEKAMRESQHALLVELYAISGQEQVERAGKAA